MSEVSKKKVIGITGSMGSGKSAVSKYISDRYPVLDCDQVNAELLEPGHAGFLALDSIDGLIENGVLDKKKMASYMFESEEHRLLIESLLHPLIFSEMLTWIDRQSSDLVFVEMPLLFEVHAEHYFDEIWCVVCDRSVALGRLEKYRGYSKQEALERLNTQMSVEQKVSKSDVVIYNNGELMDLYEQIEGLLNAD